MGFIKSFLRSQTAAKIMLEALIIPATGTIVGFEVQKRLIKREQNKMLKAQQQQVAETPEVEVIDDNDLPN